MKRQKERRKVKFDVKKKKNLQSSSTFCRLPGEQETLFVSLSGILNREKEKKNLSKVTFGTLNTVSFFFFWNP